MYCEVFVQKLWWTLVEKTVKFWNLYVLIWNSYYELQIHGQNSKRPALYNLGDASFMADI
jgi:hypothetical protein